MPREPKTVRLAVRMGETEARMLDELATKTGMAASDVIRVAIRAYHATQSGAPVSKPKKKR